MFSMLEGAVVTRAEAQEMLRQNRSALNEHERMVRNNYRAMKYLLLRKDDDLTPDIVLELHRQMTEDTLTDPAKCGCLRSDADNVRVEVDGNGRTARALFYWAMVRGGYDRVEYISISQEIDSHPKRYYLSFQKTEQDDGDLNYFIFDQLHTIVAAVQTLHGKEFEPGNELYAGEDVPENGVELNVRQKDFLQRMKQLSRGASYSVTAYCDDYKVVRQTARTDLSALVEAKLLTCRKQGKQFLYSLSYEAVVGC